jgi:hypothetical protein
MDDRIIELCLVVMMACAAIMFLAMTLAFVVACVDALLTRKNPDA